MAMSRSVRGGVAAFCAVLATACGSRTDLDLGVGADAASSLARDGGVDRSSPPVRDAGFDSGFRAPFDATLDAAFDAGFDSGFDADVDSGVDAGMDVNIQPFDAHVGADSGLLCADGGLPTAYLLDEGGAIYTFDPASLSTTLIGTPNCSPQGAWTLSVARNGKAYVVYEDWNVYEVDLTTLACAVTPLNTNTIGVPGDFGIAVSRTGTEDQIFVIGNNSTGPVLGVADLATFALTEVGPAVPSAEGQDGVYDMQADLAGHLFAFTENGFIEELSATTGQVVGVNQTSFVNGSGSWAIMTYQEQLYLFSGAQVATYDVATQVLQALGTVEGGFTVVGASAVPCQGQQ